MAIANRADSSQYPVEVPADGGSFAPHPSGSGPHVTDIPVLEYWTVLKRRRWVLAAGFALMVMTMMVWTFRQTSIYRATTTLVVEPNTPELSGLQDETPLGLTRQFYETQYEVIRSNTVISRMFEANPELARLPEFNRTANRIDILRELMSVRPIKESHLVRLSVEFPNRDSAIKLADAVAHTYIEHSTSDRRSTSRNAFQWLSGQISDMRVKLEESERQLLEYRDQEDVVSVEKRQALLEERMTSVSRELNQVAARTVELEAMLAEVRRLRDNPKLVESLPRSLDNEHVRSLKAELSRLLIQWAAVSKRYKTKHPEVVSLRSQIATVEQRLADEAQKIYDSVAIEYRLNQAKEESLTATFEEVKQESSRIADQAIRYRSLKRDAESNRQVYDVMLQRLKEADIGGNVSSENIRILDPATSPANPVKPRKALNLLLACVAGLMIGTAACFLAEQIDNTLKSEDDVQLLGEPVLGVVPWVKRLNPRSPSDRVARAYDEVKTKLRLRARDQPLRCILVTSAINSEGKTASSMLLAMAFAHAGVKTLLIDADMFRSDVFKQLGLREDGPCLTKYFDGKTTFLGAVRRMKELPSLHVLRAGVARDNPSELLGSESMLEALELAKQRFQTVIIDTPPVTASFDVAVLASMVDGVVMVAKSHRASRKIIGKVLAQLRAARANVLGVLLTATRASTESSGYYYQGNYGYYRRRGTAGAKKGKKAGRSAGKFPVASAQGSGARYRVVPDDDAASPSGQHQVVEQGADAPVEARPLPLD